MEKNKFECPQCGKTKFEAGYSEKKTYICDVNIENGYLETQGEFKEYYDPNLKFLNLDRDNEYVDCLGCGYRIYLPELVNKYKITVL